MKKLFILLTAAAALLGQPGLADEEPAAPAVECVAAVEAPAAVSAAVAEEPAAAETTPAEGAATEKKSAFCGTFWALAPALFAIVLALMTKEVYSSLFAGVVLGACFVCDF